MTSRILAYTKAFGCFFNAMAALVRVCIVEAASRCSVLLLAAVRFARARATIQPRRRESSVLQRVMTCSYRQIRDREG